MKNFLAAFLSAQRQIEGASKDATNPHFRSKYADLESILDAIKGPLNAAGITITQPLVCVGDKWCVRSVLTHSESGESIDSTMPVVCKDMEDPQKWGSAITYARRYTLQSLVALPAIDDDANTATAPKQPARQQRQNPTPPPDQSAQPDVLGEAWNIAKGLGADPTDWAAWFRNKGFDSSKAAPLPVREGLLLSLKTKVDLLHKISDLMGPEEAANLVRYNGGILNISKETMEQVIADQTGDIPL